MAFCNFIMFVICFHNFLNHHLKSFSPLIWFCFLSFFVPIFNYMILIDMFILFSSFFFLFLFCFVLIRNQPIESPPFRNITEARAFSLKSSSWTICLLELIDKIVEAGSKVDRTSICRRFVVGYQCQIHVSSSWWKGRELEVTWINLK